VKHILDDASCGRLSEFVRTKPLLVFDFDGTLAPIVAERHEARMRASTTRLLVRASALFTTAIISGRSRADVIARLPGPCVKHVIGNHGLEPAPDMWTFAREIGAMRAEITMRLRPGLDVEIEDKHYSLAIHYRKASARREARAAILRASARLRSKPRVVLGKCVVNLLPADAPDKGIALERLRMAEKADRAVYVGDDVTDEDAFALETSGRVLAIRVGLERTSKASHFVRDQGEVDALLARLIALRSEEQGHGAACSGG
jgi:trehalose 6-phosphate phosphatase